MPYDFSTENRMYRLKLQEFGENDLLIEEISGQEAVSQLFEFRLRLLSGHIDIDPGKIISKPASLRIETWDRDGRRHWNGHVTRFERTGRVLSTEAENIYTYECDIVPWLWFLTQHEDNRIFQNKTVQEIVEIIFEEFGYSDFRFDLNENHPVLEYCTQYNETSFDFISRLIEREGIHYYFLHNEGEEIKHLLVFTDNNAGNPQLDPCIVPYHHDALAEGSDAILTLSRDEQMRTRKVTLHDWDYKKKCVTSENTPTMLGIGADRDLERYRFPGGFVDPAVGRHLSKVIMEAEEASHLRFRGSSQVRTLTPGHTFTLDEHIFPEFNIKYMVLSVWHHGRNNLEDVAAQYHNEFTMQPQDVTYRAPLSTPKACVRGPQTALVVGPSQEEIYTDELGRIKVRFHWDRKVDGRQTNMPDDKATCWIRVAQMWAGNGYGSMFIPRIGNEVVVDFLEGDPDQPIVIGSVYNGLNNPPMELPEHATRSTIKTLSSKGGGGFNELRFEDKKGHEEIFMHAQKNLQVRTGNCRTEAVGVHSDLGVGKNLTESIGENHELTVGQNQTVTIGTNRALTVGNDEAKSVGANRALTVGAGDFVTVGANHHLTVGASARVSAGANYDLNAGVVMTFEAGKMLSLKAGGSSILLHPAGVTIVGTLVTINSGGAGKSAMKPDKGDLPPKAAEAQKAAMSKAGKITGTIGQLAARALRKGAAVASAFVSWPFGG